MDEMEQLAYKNRFVRQLVQDLSNYEASDATPQVISGPENLILLQVSFEEWIKLTSSLFTGADICYPSESDSVRWILYRAVEQPMDLCALIANCIATNPATKQAIIDMLKASDEFNQHIQETATIGQPMTLPQIEAPIGDSCDEDAAFGGWSALIRQMDANNRDLFERIEVGSNAIERTNITISALPGIGILPVDELIDFFDELLDNLVENYVAQYTTTLEDELRCGLFCLALDNECALNFDQVFTYFNDRLAASFTIESLLLDILSFIGAGTWSGTQIVDAMMLLQVAILRTSSTFIDFAVYSLQSTYQLGLNDPDPDWSTLCDCAPPPANCNDLTAAANGWYPSTNTGVASSSFGVYIAGQGCAPHQTTRSFFFTRASNPSGPGAVNSVTLEFNSPVTNISIRKIGGSAVLYTGAAATSITFTQAAYPTLFPLNLQTTAIGVTPSGNLMPTIANRMTGFCWNPV